MRRQAIALFVTVLVCSFSAAAQVVVEEESAIVINDRTADVALVIDSRSNATHSAIELALLDPAGNTRASWSQPVRILSGTRKYKLTLPIGHIAASERDDIAWWRLTYRVGDRQGVVSLSELMRDDFDLRASTFQRVVPGEPLRVRVRALHPFSEAPVKGVAITADLKLSVETDSDNDEIIIKGTARTNGNGFAMIDLKIPDGLTLDGDPEITITGQKRGVLRKIEEEIDDDEMRGSALLTTDKPLYQPGQTFNVRALLLDPYNTVVTNREIEFTIEDEDDTILYRQKVMTSAFGIASIAWPIPENAKLGNYRVIVDADADLREDQLQFKVSRYDLPNFTVTTKSDKSYYLLSDTEARVDVSAGYLFGKPVTGGKVRVVQESERRWNYSEQKYDVEEGPVVEGATDATGKFTARIDLRTQIAELKSSEWRRFEDLSFAAYYTDLSTNRTEQRRFDIRLTKEPIHIYLIRYADQHAELPLTAYVSTFYADGTPARCNVEISDQRKNKVARFRTNSLGAGKFEIEIPPSVGSQYNVRILARDDRGQMGTFDESFYLSRDDDAIQIVSDKAIYKPGEMIDLELRSTRRNGIIYVDVVKDWMPVDSRVVELSKGKARLTIPYRASLTGDLLIAAYSDEETGGCCTMRAVRGIIFPEQQNLLLDAKFSKDIYKPAEEAKVMFAVRDASRRPVASAIGLGIFDKAIEERARTDAEFGGYFNRFYRLLGYDRSFGNITLNDLNDLDLSRPVSPEMQLAAEIMLAGNWYFPTVYHSGNNEAQAKAVYVDVTKQQIKPVADAIEARFKKDHAHPIDQTSFGRILADAGIDHGKLLDPWGQPYAVEYSIERTRNIVTIRTTGPDKRAATADDFSVWTSGFNYFTKTGSDIDRVVNDHHKRTGQYVRDLSTLIGEMERAGIYRGPLKDRWGRDYRVEFEVSGRNYVIRITSNGPNGIPEASYYGRDDFEVWTTYTDYFVTSEQEINRVLAHEVNAKKKRFPRSEAEFAALLFGGGLDLATIKDGYGRPVHVVGTIEARYTDQTKVEYGKTTIVPVTEEMMVFKVRSKGANTEAPSDDADLATFSGALTEAHRGTGLGKVEVETTVFSGAKGAIGGTVVDPQGAVIPGAEVVATNDADASLTFAATSNDEGKFLLANLPSGQYTLTIRAPGFKNAVYSALQVRSQTLLQVDVSLGVGAVSETVSVVGDVEAMVVNTTSASVSTTRKSNNKIEFPYKEQTSTPRLREYFPESLVWQPELVTDKKGKAEFSFKMADNITTWKMFAIASNKKGKVGVVEKEVTAFQSFFVDLDPPKFLTEGDEIYLPTQVRNYTEKKQRVDVTMAENGWFSLLGAGKQAIEVESNGSRNAVFGFKAVTPIKDGKQRVTAMAQTDSDAIERPVTVRPNGQEVVRTDSKLSTGGATFDLAYPQNALRGTQRAELKIYPNLYSHVAESVEGLLQRPYGCGEQTISSTYPNLMVLKFAKSDSAIAKKARKYLQAGYERLLGYQVADGGFAYWGGRDTSDVALTAYAVRFLNDASAQIAVDADVIKRAEEWLIRQQRADGSWTKRYYYDTADDAKRTKLITTYVARSLAMRKSAPNAALTRGLEYLKARNAEIDEPYALSLYGLALLDKGDTSEAHTVAELLEKMAIVEGNAAYWTLETNTPFYGWGTAGRIETTALVLQLLIRDTQNAGGNDSERKDLISKATLFLLKNKDRYGVWYSTQTTINVLDAFLASLGNKPAGPQQIAVSINGSAVRSFDVKPDDLEALTLELSDKFNGAPARIDVTSSSDTPIMAQIVASHYIDWKDANVAGRSMNQSRALRLDYKCDKPAPAIMEEVACSVEAERVGHQGYGMLLAEIGTPPGADVSRESLEKAVQADWSISRYDILPDRIVVYMWSKPGGSKFNFKFKPRYGVNAQTPASMVYDYYNPEAQATVAPLKFVAK